MKRLNFLTKINSKTWLKVINSINELWKLCQYDILFLAFMDGNIKNKNPVQQLKPQILSLQTVWRTLFTSCYKELRPILDAVLKQGVLRLFQHGLVRLGTPLF